MDTSRMSELDLELNLVKQIQLKVQHQFLKKNGNFQQQQKIKYFLKFGLTRKRKKNKKKNKRMKIKMKTKMKKKMKKKKKKKSQRFMIKILIVNQIYFFVQANIKYLFSGYLKKRSIQKMR